MKLIVIFGAIICGTSACKQESVAPSETPSILVSTETVSARKLPTYLSLPGTTVAVQEVEVQARVKGWLLQRHFQEGQVVTKGDLLFEIDSQPYDAQLLQAGAVLLSAKAQASYAQKEYDRNEPLVQTGAVSKQAFDTVVLQFEQATAQVSQALAGVALAALNVEYCAIHAPLSGIIGNATADAGALVGPGVQASLAKIVQTSPMFVELHPPANRLQAMQSLMSDGPLAMQITFKENNSEGQASAGESVLTTHKLTGSIVFIDNTIQSSSSTFLSRGEFINKIGVLPGQYAQVRIQLQMIEAAVMVPTKALMQQPGSYYVWTISEDSTAVMIPVTVGAVNGSYQHVLTGLHDGDGVIVDGTTSLRSGAKVMLSKTTEETE
jgi:membrane fusion protein, multidrug efflux system